MTATRIYPDGTICQYGRYDTVLAFRKAYDSMAQWRWVPNTLEGYAQGHYEHTADDKLGYIVLID